MKRGIFGLTLALILAACGGDGDGPTSPGSTPIPSGTYSVNAVTQTNTCGPGLDEDLLEAIDGQQVQVRRDGDNYSIGFDVFIPATVNGDNLRASTVFTVTAGSATLSFDWDFSSDRRTFDGTIDVDVRANNGETCRLTFLTHGEKV
jgi:hypothetical protein